ncbi:hypothetical protein BC941DRAFT_475437 [Chlamydoabsidia padenii]|nr:hypothetical protein BC941DRAFT_475437 [Chlamydoabsidia padenii]
MAWLSTLFSRIPSPSRLELNAPDLNNSHQHTQGHFGLVGLDSGRHDIIITAGGAGDRSFAARQVSTDEFRSISGVTQRQQYLEIQKSTTKITDNEGNNTIFDNLFTPIFPLLHISWVFTTLNTPGTGLRPIKDSQKYNKGKRSKEHKKRNRRRRKNQVAKRRRRHTMTNRKKYQHGSININQTTLLLVAFGAGMISTNHSHIHGYPAGSTNLIRRHLIEQQRRSLCIVGHTNEFLTSQNGKRPN